MIEREMKPILCQRAEQFPVVTVVGPRQSGKTTLVRDCFPNYSYVSLEDPETREMAESDYRRFLSLYSAPVIIDEIQNVPKLVSAIQTLVDQDRNAKGRYILTGSHKPRLKEAVTQSLAGRNAFLTLLPLSFTEMKTAGLHIDLSSDSLILRGGMPELANSNINPNIYYRNYIQTYLERDVRQIANIKKFSSFMRFITLLAGRTGQLVNLDSLSGEVGVSHTTLSEWLDVLEASFIVFRLQPYFCNIGKRLVKTPKLYFSETGLATCLLGIKTPEQVARDPLRGQLFENLVVSNILKHTLNTDSGDGIFFFRTAKGLEVDVLRETPEGLQPIEIKSSMTWSHSLADGLRTYRKNIPDATLPTLVYAGRTMPSGEDGVSVRNFLEF